VATLSETSPHQGVALLHIVLQPGRYAPGAATLSAFPAATPLASIDDHAIALA
jgi:hypothetical protein